MDTITSNKHLGFKKKKGKVMHFYPADFSWNLRERTRKQELFKREILHETCS